MPMTKLTEFDQGIHIQGGGPAQHGICYYICDYVESHNDSPWKRPKDFTAAKQGVTRMRTAPLVAAGKAANLKKVPQDGGYLVGITLKKNSVYRVELAVNKAVDAQGNLPSPNHETMVLTGDDEMIMFDPNYGFFHVDGIAVGQHRAVFEQRLAGLYQAIPVMSFGFNYKRKAFYEF